MLTFWDAGDAGRVEHSLEGTFVNDKEQHGYLVYKKGIIASHTKDPYLTNQKNWSVTRTLDTARKMFLEKVG